jgi:ABC-type polysaccharide/polyol phosphate transport system ATPase subunit
MADISLELNHVYKKFRKGEIYDSLRDLIPAMTGKFLRGQREASLDKREFWALSDVSFQVARGEAVGIIGSNGAGKSTMLKLLSGIMKPTSGTLKVSGTLSALIEVGAGFHPDLTGRENIFLNGAILGMKRNEIKTKFDQIVEFSGLGEFIDTPVKRYSSGMFARLGFSVAAHVDPDVLLVDEVLSVGDYVFQQKCAARMAEVLKGGTTIVFVSHNLRAVIDLCHRAVLLDHGTVLEVGPTSDMVRRYMELVGDKRSTESHSAVRMDTVTVRNATGPTVKFTAGEKAWIDVTMTAKEDCQNVAVVLELKDNSYYEVFNTSTERLGEAKLNLRAGQTASYTFEVDLHLANGAFHIGAYLYRYDTETTYDHWFPITTIFIQSEKDVRGAVNIYPRVIARSTHG